MKLLIDGDSSVAVPNSRMQQREMVLQLNDRGGKRFLGGRRGQGRISDKDGDADWEACLSTADIESFDERDLGMHKSVANGRRDDKLGLTLSPGSVQSSHLTEQTPVLHMMTGSSCYCRSEKFDRR